MGQRPKHFDESMAIRRASSPIEHTAPLSGTYASGVVLTYYGIVWCYSQNAPHPHTRYDVVFKGRLYTRTENRGRTDRGLALQATKFAREIALRVSTGASTRGER